MNKKMKQNGITLIILIITIIILIISVGVVISIVIGENVAKEEPEALEKINKATEGENMIPATTELKAGDYVKYDTGDTSIGEKGVIVCRVLYEASSEYGLQIISDKSIKKLELGGSDWEKGKVAYNNVIETLNNEAEKYLNKQYAVDARCVGSQPTNNKGIFINKNSEIKETVLIPKSEWNTYIRPSGWGSDDTGCKNTDTNYQIDYDTMGTLEIRDTKEAYWLASRQVSVHSNFCFFNVRYIIYGGELVDNNLCSVYRSNGNTGGTIRTNGLRACFSLKSDIKIIEGDGTSEETAYVLGI